MFLNDSNGGSVNIDSTTTPRADPRFLFVADVLNVCCIDSPSCSLKARG
jgi:hypothetical protein